MSTEEDAAARLAKKRASDRERQQRYRDRHRAAGQAFRDPDAPTRGSGWRDRERDTGTGQFAPSPDGPKPNAEKLRNWREGNLALTRNTDPGNSHFDENGKAAPGNKLAVTHGAKTQGRVSEVAAVLLTALFADPNTPDYLRDSSYSRELLAWAEAEARVTLLRAYIDEHGIERGMTEVTISQEVETSTGDKTTVTRVLNAEKIASVFSELHKAETLAANRRIQCGLTPLSRTRITKDLAATGFDLARMWAEEDARETAAKEAAKKNGKAPPQQAS